MLSLDRVVNRLPLGHFCSMTTILPESYQNEMTTKRFSQYVNVVTGLS